MLHLGQGYSKLLQSCNVELNSQDVSFPNEDASDLDIVHNQSHMKNSEKELDGTGLDISCQKLPQIRSSSNLTKFSRHK